MLPELKSPQGARRAHDGLVAVSSTLTRERDGKASELATIVERIARAPRVEDALQKLSDEMFSNIVGVLEEKLTIALQEVLEQPIKLKADVTFKRKSANVEFHIERDGNGEDIMRGQGGSVANVLSVGLRLFALRTLDATHHRRFLVLDEQDCWLRPELVPRLVRIVREAGDALGFQVLMISHHDHQLFEDYADRIYECIPQPDGSVEVVLRHDEQISDESSL